MRENTNNSRFLALTKFIIVCFLATNITLPHSNKMQAADPRAGEDELEIQRVAANQPKENKPSNPSPNLMQRFDSSLLDVPAEFKEKEIRLDTAVQLSVMNSTFESQKPRTRLAIKDSAGREHIFRYRLGYFEQSVSTNGSIVTHRLEDGVSFIQKAFDGYIQQLVVFNQAPEDRRIPFAYSVSENITLDDSRGGYLAVRTRDTNEELLLFRQPQGVDSLGNRVDYHAVVENEKFYLEATDPLQLEYASYPIEIHFNAQPITWSEALVKIGDNCEETEACELDGDIIQVMPAGWNWGLSELSGGKFIIVKIPKVSDEDRHEILARTRDDEEDIESGEEDLLFDTAGLVRFGMNYTELLTEEQTEEVRAGNKNKIQIDLRSPHSYVVSNPSSAELLKTVIDSGIEAENSKDKASDSSDEKLKTQDVSALPLDSSTATASLEVSGLVTTSISSSIELSSLVERIAVTRPFHAFSSVFDLVKKKVREKLKRRTTEKKQKSTDIEVSPTSTATSSESLIEEGATSTSVSSTDPGDVATGTPSLTLELATSSEYSGVSTSSESGAVSSSTEITSSSLSATPQELSATSTEPEVSTSTEAEVATSSTEAPNTSSGSGAIDATSTTSSSEAIGEDKKQEPALAAPAEPEVREPQADPRSDLSDLVTTTFALPPAMEFSDLIVTSTVIAPENPGASFGIAPFALEIQEGGKKARLSAAELAERRIGVIQKKISPRVSVVPAGKRLVYKNPKPPGFFKKIVKRITSRSEAATVAEASIGTASRDYSTISAWETARNVNPIASGTIEKGVLYNDSEFSEASTITIDTTNSNLAAGNNLWLTVAEGQWHKGRINSTEVVRLTTTDTSHIMTVSDPWVRIERIVFKNWGSGSSVDYALETTTNTGNEIRFNVFDGRFNKVAIGLRTNSDNHNYYGNFFLNLPGGSAGSSSGAAFLNGTAADGNKFYNNTIVSASSAFSLGDSSTDVELINNIVASTTVMFQADARYFNSKSGANLSTLNTSTNSSTDIMNVPFASLFVSTASGSEDLRLRAGSPALDLAANVASGTVFAYDIEEELRGTDYGYDIGADEQLYSVKAFSRCRVESNFSTTTSGGGSTWAANDFSQVVTPSTTITSVSSSFLFPVNSTLGTGNTLLERAVITGYISSTGDLVFTRSATSTSALAWSYNLIECFDNEFTVQRGVVSVSQNATSATSSITAVESASSSIILILPEVYTSSGMLSSQLASGRLLNSSTIEIIRDNTATSSAIEARYEVVSFTSSSGVRIRGIDVTQTFTSATTTTSTITRVATSTSLVLCQYDANTDTNAGVTLGCNLQNSSTVSFIHGTTTSGMSNRIQAYVIQFPSGTVSVQRGSSYIDIETTDGNFLNHDIPVTSTIKTRLKAFPFVSWPMPNTGKASPRERWIYSLASTSLLRAAYRRPTTGTGPDHTKYWQIAEFPSPHLTQSAYRWFQNLDSAGVGTATSALNSSLTVTTSTPARLRMLLHVSSTSLMPTSSQQFFRLQYATSSGGVGTCDTSFNGENYVNTGTAAGPIHFHDNPSVGNATALVSSSSDPTDGAHTVRPQTYKEDNYFSNTVSFISSSEDGMWDFSVSSTDAVVGYTYCFRIVHQNGDLLQTYSVIPELTIASAASSWLDSAWLNRKTITFNNISSSEDLINFPVTVILTSSTIDYSKTRNSGQDIRFTDSNGTTPLQYEIEKWDENATSVVHVKVPVINGTSTSDFIYMYYNNTSASDASTPTEVWNSDFVGIWHLSESPSSTAPQALDSTLNNNDGTASGTLGVANLVDGKINGAWNLSDSNNEVRVSSTSDLNPYPLTISVWTNSLASSTNGNDRGIVNKYASASANGYNIMRQGTNIYAWYFRNGTDNIYPGSPGINGGAVSTTDWVHIGFVVNATQGIIYINGKITGSSTWNGTAGVATTTQALHFGYYQGGNYFPGRIDEVRISKTARSTSWIRAEALNGQNYFNTFGDEEAGTSISCSSDITTSTFTNITPSDIASSSPISTTISCTSATGCNITLVDTGLSGESGLASSTASELIESPSNAATSTLSAGQDAFGVQVATSSNGSGLTLGIAGRYFQTGLNIGHVSTTEIVVASSSGSFTDRELLIQPYATVGPLTPVGTGYSDTLTITCTAN